MTAGAFLEFVQAVTCAGIAIALYPVLRKHNEGLALGSVALRIIEGVLYTVGSISLLLLLTVSQESAKGGSPDPSFFQNAGVLLVAGRDWLGPVAAVMAFGMGALMYYYVFYQARLIPRWLSAWGIVGATLTIAAGILTMLRAIDPWSTGLIVLNVPIAVQELVLAVWLIARGFYPAATAAECADGTSPRRAAAHTAPAT